MFAKYGTSARLQIDYTYMNFHVVANHALRENIFFPTLNGKYDKVITSYEQYVYLEFTDNTYDTKGTIFISCIMNFGGYE